MLQVLLQEAVSHDSAMKYLADSRTFVVDHCLVVDRPWADEAIANGECGEEDGRRERGRTGCGKEGGGREGRGTEKKGKERGGRK